MNVLSYAKSTMGRQLDENRYIRYKLNGFEVEK